MKSIRLLILGLAAALCAPTRFTTANAEAPTPANSAGELEALKAELARATEALKAQGEQLQALTLAKDAPVPAPEVDSELSRLAKGAGLDGLSDVSWRVRAGLSAKQAVDAAVAQIADNKAREEREAKEKAEAEAAKKKR
jgi:hypothetical protein